MMKIFLASDIHFEFHNAPDWLPPLPSNEQFDVLVLVGDVGHGAWLTAGLRRLSKKFPGKPIVFVPGNHEYYRRNIDRSPLDDGRIEDLYCLEKGCVDLLGYRFLGTTMWTGFDTMGPEYIDRAMHLSKYSIADFMEIRTAELSETNGVIRFITPEFMRELYHQSKRWLEVELEHAAADKTIVVTHFPPCRELQHGLIPESLVSAYFQSNCIDLIRKYQPALWLYGHNHWSDQRRFGKTRVISNQFGYPREKTRYQSGLIIELPDRSECV